jgi:hypothetical protein
LKNTKLTPSVFIKHLMCTSQRNFEHKQFNQIYNTNNNQQLNTIKEIKIIQRICLGSSHISRLRLSDTSPPNSRKSELRMLFQNQFESVYTRLEDTIYYNQIEKMSNLMNAFYTLNIDLQQRPNQLLKSSMIP